MTAYFDDVARGLREARQSGGYNLLDVIETRLVDVIETRLVDVIETRLVRDCTVAVELPSFPWFDLRLAVHHKVLSYGVCTLPAEAEPADFETEEEHEQRLCMLNGDLHTIFHEVAHRSRDAGMLLSDDPRRGVDLLVQEGEEMRSRLAEIARWGPVRDEASAIGLVRREADAPLCIEWRGANGEKLVAFDTEVADGRYWYVPILGHHFRFEAEALRAFLEARERELARLGAVSS